MNKFSFIVIGVLVLFVLGIFFILTKIPSKNEEVVSQPETIQENKEMVFCLHSQTGEKMSLDEAKKIASESECLQEGSLKETFFCNENTGTWWLDLKIDKPGCAPACVVDISTGKAEINWRCTGLITP